MNNRTFCEVAQDSETPDIAMISPSGGGSAAAVAAAETIRHGRLWGPAGNKNNPAAHLPPMGRCRTADMGPAGTAPQTRQQNACQRQFSLLSHSLQLALCQAFRRI